jgi:hypothetical protein
MPRSHQRMLLALAVVAVTVPVLESVLHLSSGVLFVLPALLLAVPLLFGRYLGERTLSRLAGKLTPQRPRRTAARPRVRPTLVLLPRGGRLIAASLAVRPPPRGGLLTR